MFIMVSKRKLKVRLLVSDTLKKKNQDILYHKLPWLRRRALLLR